MNISYALKHKNRLAKAIAGDMEQAIPNRFAKPLRFENQSDAEEASEAIKVAMKSNLATILQKKSALAQHKADIAVANAEIWYDIFLLAEMKGLLNSIKAAPAELSSIEGSRVQDGVIYNVNYLDVADQKNILAEIEGQIYQLQDKIDTFNAKTELPTRELEPEPPE